MAFAPNALHESHALVIEGNPQSRSILVSQLRELGLGKVSQCSRLSDARRKLEATQYDVIICEQNFDKEPGSGQDLLDDLRRNQLLPFHTVFVMVTAEASYAKVAEAAESALDAYLLKPHTGARLAERILQARQRKRELQAIFLAIDEQDFNRAASLCLERFESRASYWLYAARIGAELLLRTGRIAEAQQLYEAVIQAKALPWAKLGVARTQLSSGHASKAATTLESLLQEDPGYADAYDVMGRTQFELGNFENAQATFRMATQLTPGSISRLLKHGMLAYYAGDREEGIALLDRATRLGIDSKMYDPQALVLLAFARLDAGDRKGMAQVVDQLQRLRERSFEPERPYRLLEFVKTIEALLHQQNNRVIDDIRHLVKQGATPEFDFEMATNLLGLMGRASTRGLPLSVAEARTAVEQLDMRFCTSRAMSELLAAAATGQEDYARIAHECHTRVLKITEQAMTLSIKGDPRGTVMRLLQEGESTLNAKLIESAHQVLLRHSARIPDFEELNQRVDAMRTLYRTSTSITRMGDNTAAGTAPGAMALPTGYKPPKREGLLDHMRND
ncbi:response regulator [Hydrogenophaga flava]|uniref:response regulator n=1 Tax=Hydrogenophaga flava TaxID=65657 RepID=UPI00082656E1|nr:tetratricopeptide repeat protein [Hydrogenophaga flava]